MELINALDKHYAQVPFYARESREGKRNKNTEVSKCSNVIMKNNWCRRSNEEKEIILYIITETMNFNTPNIKSN